MSQNSSTKYQFPLLQVEEMVSKATFFPEMHLTAADLHGDLNAERIQKIYLIFMQYLTGMTKEHLMQPSIDARFVQEFPSIHEEANYKLKLSIFMNRILVACSYDGFCLQDLTSPDRKTTFRILSALFNFCAHYEGRYEKFSAIKDRQKAKVEQMQTMLAENDALRRRINDLKVMQEEEESQASTESTLAGLKERSLQLSSQIVQSPERMKREDAHLLQTIERLRATGVEKTNRLSEATQQAKAAADLLQEMERLLKQLKAVTDTVAQHELEQDELV